jgi:hypothetical protein
MVHWHLTRFVAGNVLGPLLTVAAAVATTLSVVQFWASDLIFDSDRFAGKVTEVSRREDVRSELTGVIVDQVLDQQPDLVGVRPLIEVAVHATLASPAVRPVITTAARELHRAVFRAGERNLILDLTDALTLVQAAVRAYDPDLAARIPAVGPGAVDLGARNIAVEAAAANERIREARWVLAALAALFGAGALALMRSHRVAVLLYGLALAGCALGVWLALGLAAEYIGHAFRDRPAVAVAAVGIWDAYTGQLAWWMWLQALAGVILAAFATGLATTEPAPARVRRLAAELLTLADHRPGRLLAGLFLVAYGVALVIAPATALRVTAQGVGLLVFYVGGAELFRALGLGVERRPAPQASPLRRAAAQAPRAGAAVLLVSGVAVAGVFFYLNRGNLGAGTAEARPDVSVCNGSEALCARRLNDVVFAATHNSMSAAADRGWYFAYHQRGIKAQLEAGFRAFLIDVYYGYATNNGVRSDPATTPDYARLVEEIGEEAIAAAEGLAQRFGPIPPRASPALYLCHGLCELGATSFDSTLRVLRRFLEDNPGEVVILFLQDYVDPFDVEAAFVRTGTIPYVVTLAPGEPLPTLGEMVRLDRRVLVLSENMGSVQRPAWYHDGFALVQDTGYVYRSVEAMDCALNRGAADHPLLLLNHWVAAFPPRPSDAQRANSRAVLLERVERCEAERGQVANLIAVDFFESGDTVAVVQELNRRPLPAR